MLRKGSRSRRSSSTIAKSTITAYLFQSGGHENPFQLQANEGKSFIGCFVLGMGFTFDDFDTKGVATPLAEMERLIAKDRRRKKIPYIGGEEVNDSPTHSHHRYVIKFENFPLRREDVGDNWKSRRPTSERNGFGPGLSPRTIPMLLQQIGQTLQILERNVKPARMEDNRTAYRRSWWQFAEKRPELMRSLSRRSVVLAINCGATPSVAFARLESSSVFSHTLALSVSPNLGHSRCCRVGCIRCRHAEASSMKDDVRYTPSDCFESFPFPAGIDTHPILERVGRDYYESAPK